MPIAVTNIDAKEIYAFNKRIHNQTPSLYLKIYMLRGFLVCGRTSFPFPNFKINIEMFHFYT